MAACGCWSRPICNNMPYDPQPAHQGTDTVGTGATKPSVCYAQEIFNNCIAFEARLV